MYEETLSLSKSAFKDLNTYHTTMFAAATKMARLLTSMNDGSSAKKYFDIANIHNSQQTQDPIQSVQYCDESAGDSSFSSNSSCSTDSTSIHSNDGDQELITQISF